MMLDSRSKRVLWAVIESYIDSPDPVGSRYVTKKYEFGLSPATIRNIMADLEDMGFLMQPHTSAGRVPTDRGYRFYVENILHPEMPDEPDFSRRIMDQLSCVGCDVDDMLHEATRLISSFSHYLGVASSPRADTSIFHRIEFINYKNDRIAVMLFTDEGVIRHKIIRNEFGLKQADLNRIASYLNSQFRGMNMKEIRAHIVSEMKKEKDEVNMLVSRALEIFGGDGQPGDEVFISGFSEVVNLPDFADVEKIKQLSEAIEDKHTILKLLEQIDSEDGIQVIIGSENRVEGMKNMSVVISTYKDRERPVGAIGIIGPKRMNYQYAIAIVDTTAKCLSRMLCGEIDHE